MTNKKYIQEFQKLKKESNYKYFLVGSPSHLWWVNVVQGNTFQELWDELIKIDEIDLERYDKDNKIYDEEKDAYYVQEPEDYKEAIEKYLKTSNNFYYRKFSWQE